MRLKIQMVKRIIQLALTVAILFLCPIVLPGSLLLFLMGEPFLALALIWVPGIIPLIWLKKKKKISDCL